MNSDVLALGMALLGVIFAVIGYLLARKDAAQEKLIDDLYEKHEADARRLNEFEVKIAETHYPKTEVQALLENFKHYLNERFDRIEHAVGVERRKQ